MYTYFPSSNYVMLLPFNPHCSPSSKNPANLFLFKCVFLFVACSLEAQEPQRPNHCKTPIQILHEYGIKKGSFPVYVMEKAEGEAHHPSFVYRVTIGEVTCTGELLHQPCCVDRSLSLNDACHSDLTIQKVKFLPLPRRWCVCRFVSPFICL